MKSISSGVDPDPEVNDTEEEGSLNLSVEKIEETAQISDIGTEVCAAGFSEYSYDLVSSKSTRKRQKQVWDMLKRPQADINFDQWISATVDKRTYYT